MEPVCLNPHARDPRRGRAFSGRLGGSLRPGFFGSTRVEGNDVAGGLQAIESVGWRLLDCSYVFMPVKERAFSTTKDANVIGLIVGIYTFRRS